jgi:hypothetical protein
MHSDKEWEVHLGWVVAGTFNLYLFQDSCIFWDVVADSLDIDVDRQIVVEKRLLGVQYFFTIRALKSAT